MDWNIQNILIVAGIIFIFVSKVKIDGKLIINVTDENAKSILKFGFAFLIIGIILPVPSIYKAPVPDTTTPTPVEKPIQIATPAQTINENISAGQPYAKIKLRAATPP
jgi:hypothetical protein